jgi:hypothetical protein
MDLPLSLIFALEWRSLLLVRITNMNTTSDLTAQEKALKFIIQ